MQSVMRGSKVLAQVSRLGSEGAIVGFTDGSEPVKFRKTGGFMVRSGAVSYPVEIDIKDSVVKLTAPKSLTVVES